MKYKFFNRKNVFNEAYISRPDPIFTIIIFVLSFAVYANTLFNGFVHDDNFQVVKNVWIKNAKYITEIFLKDVWGFHNNTSISMSNYYRPMMYIIFMINYHIFGLNPTGFHLVNILFHAGNSLLVFFLLLKLLKKYIPDNKSLIKYVFFGAILFAIHPIHTEAVAWISAIPELSYTFFFLLSFYFYIKWREDEGRKTFYIISLFSFVISVYCKEPALTLPFFLFIYDISFGQDKLKSFKSFTPYIAFIFFALIYLAMRFTALGGFAPVSKFENIDTIKHIMNILPLFTMYLEKLLLPLNLNAFYVYKPIDLISFKGIISLVITLAFIISIFVGFKKHKLFSFGLLLIIVPLMPVLYAPFLGFNVFTERYLYLPSIGFFMLLALITGKLCERKIVSDKGIAIFMVILTVLYSTGTIKRNMVWKDDFTLSSDMVKKSPESSITNIYFGGMLYLKGDIDKALKHFETALHLPPHTPRIASDVYIGIAKIYQKKGLTNEALKQLHTALSIDRTNPDVYMSLGEIYLDAGMLDKAIASYASVLNQDRTILEAYNNLGIALAQKGLIDEAIEAFQGGLKIFPEDLELKKNLERAYKIKRGF